MASVSIRPFKAEDLGYLCVKPRYVGCLSAVLGAPELRVLENQYAYTAWRPEGVAVACCGIYRGRAWALVGENLGASDALAVTRRVRRVLEEHRMRDGPVRTMVDTRYPDAVRWAQALGLTLDASRPSSLLSTMEALVFDG